MGYYDALYMYNRRNDESEKSPAIGCRSNGFCGEYFLSIYTMSKTKSTSARQSSGYTINDLRAAIPPHCFKPNTFTSALYILRDIVLVSTIFYLGTNIPSIGNDYARRFSYIAYGICQGFTCTALWLIAHECGHGALSPHKWFNHSVGLVIHTVLLTPYHSWRYSHQTHHKKTNNLDGDIGFVPPKKDSTQEKLIGGAEGLHFYDLFEDTPLGTFFFLIVYQLVAWPCYLILNNSSLARITRFEWWKRSHFYLGGDGPSFAPRHFRGVLMSDIAMASMMLCLWQACRMFGGQNVMIYYGMPYLWVNHWMGEHSQ
jgi:omega-6 fatty acid desaturase / acyl-lipid omega-6 desaturase (Delta-12 desaturase)